MTKWLADRFELSRGGARMANVRPMEGLRGFAVVLVFAVHFVELGAYSHCSNKLTLNQCLDLGSPLIAPGLTSWIALALHDVGHSGVDLFFVLSGYLIYGSLIAKPQPFLRFMRRRVERLYPAFVVVFCSYVVLSQVFRAESKIPNGIPAAFVYLLENLLLLPGLFPIRPLITVAWSLSYEMAYYLVMPLLIAGLSLRSWTPRRRVTLFAMLAVTLAILCASSSAFGRSEYSQAAPVRLIMFIAGIVLFEVIRHGLARAPNSRVGALFLLAGVLVMLPAWRGEALYTVRICGLFVAYFTVCFVCFERPTEWLARVFSWTPLRWLGNMSYSYYLVHALTLKAAYLALSRSGWESPGGPLVFWALLPSMFFLTLLPSAALFLGVERPLSLTTGNTTRHGLQRQPVVAPDSLP